MNDRAGFRALGPGAITIVAEVADDRISSVRVDSSRPTNLTRLFIDRPADEVPILAERLYSLCGFSHASAATAAIAAARGEAPDVARFAPQRIGLLCERIAETLRSTAMSTVDQDGGATSRPLRDILSTARELTALATRAPTALNAAPSLIARLRAAAAELGVPDSPRAPPRSGSWLDRLWKEARAAAAFQSAAPDALRPDDDAAILTRLRQAGESFAATPSLPCRTPETGAFARHWRDVDLADGALSARWRARIIDLALNLDRLSRALDEADDETRRATPAQREGFAAVTTSRGDLYHWARLTPDDRVHSYAIVAPTEWNFHPAGPFVAALLGAGVKRTDARDAIARLASLFDPCVVLHVEVPEAARA